MKNGILCMLFGHKKIRSIDEPSFIEWDVDKDNIHIRVYLCKRCHGLFWEDK